MQFFTQLCCVMGCIQSSLFIPLYLTPVWILAVLWYLKHTISCQLLYLHSSCFCCKCFLLTLEETSIAPCALLVRTKITQLLVTSNMLSLQTYKADILSKYCRGSFTLLKINNTCFKDLLFHWNFVFKWKKK